MIHRLHRLWKILGSRQLAVILLATLALALLLGSLFPQMPSDPASQETWLEAVNLRYGPATGMLQKLGMFQAYHSVWFLALLAALLSNTLICTVQRLPGLWRSLTESPVVQRPEAFYQGFARHKEWMLGALNEGLAAVRETLVKHRLRTHIEHDGESGGASVYAEQGRWSQAGSLLSHFAAVLLVVAVACGPALGWQESALTRDTVSQVGRDPTFGLALAGGVLLLVTVVISLWVPYRRLWLRVDSKGRAAMVGAGDWADEFDTIATEIAHACHSHGEGDG